jgi:hypothetical protein
MWQLFSIFAAGSQLPPATVCCPKAGARGVESSGKEKPKLSDFVNSHRVPIGPAAKNQNKNRSPHVKKGLAPFGANPFLMTYKTL